MIEIDDTIRDKDYEDLATILAMSLFPLLKDNEGVAVHWQGEAFIVGKIFDEDSQEWRVKIIQDDDMLAMTHLQLLWLHDEPVGNG